MGARATTTTTPHPQRSTYFATPDQLRTLATRRGRDLLAGRVTDPDDPRYTGMSGAYPGLDQRAPYALPRKLYDRVGVLRTIVDLPADDIWSKGWEILAEDEDAAKHATTWDQRVRIKTAFREATKMARRDGYALIYLRVRDATGDPAQPPRGVRSILRATVLTRDVVERIEWDTDPDSDTFEEPAYYHLRFTPPSEYGPLSTHGVTITPTTKTVRVHRDRIIFVVQHPKNGNNWDGDSVLSWLLGDTQAFENIKWAAAETYFNWARPLLKVTIDEDLDLDPDNSADKERLDELETNVEKLQSGVSQKIIQQGFTVEALGDSARINSPDPYAKMFMDQMAGGARIPQREITGDPAGALAAASWDVKRYMSRIDNDRDDFATPLVWFEWYARLDSWGLVPGLKASITGIHWFPHLDLSEKERAEVLDVTARAIQGFRNAGVPIPEEVGKLVTWPMDFDPATLPPLPPPVNPFAPPQPAHPPSSDPTPPATPPTAEDPEEGTDDEPPTADTHRPRADLRHAPRRPWADLRIEVTPLLWAIEDRIEGGVRRAYREWRKTTLAAVKEATTEARRGFFRRRADTVDPTVTARIRLTPDTLTPVLQRALEEAARVGLMRTWANLGGDGVLEFLDRTEARALQRYVELYGQARAETVTREVRLLIGDLLANGKGVREIESALKALFDGLENSANVARTESMRGYNEGSRAAMREAKIAMWEWATYSGACPTCAPKEGQRFPLDAPMPPEASHVNCRCTIIPVVEAA